MFIVTDGVPGAGKTCFTKTYLEEHQNACVFHMPDILKPAGRYRSILSDEERTFIDNNWSDNLQPCRQGGIADFSDGRLDLVEIALRVIDILNKKYDIVVLDAFPRNMKQAKAFDTYCLTNKKKVHIISFLIKENEYEFSIARQVLRAKESGRFHYGMLRKFSVKAQNYFNETRPAMEFLKSRYPFSNCFISQSGAVCTPKQELFDSIHSKDGKTSHFCNESYVYPVSIDQYIDYWRSPDILRAPIMATITLGNYCGDRCKGCFNAHMDDKTELEPSVLTSFIKDYGANGGLCVKAAGREPTLYPYLDRFVYESRDAGLFSCIITGGAKLSQYEDLLRTSCDHLRVSLNAYSTKVHDEIHCPHEWADSFETRQRVLASLLPERQMRGLTTGVTYLDRSENKGELIPFIERWKQADYIRLASLNYMFGNRESKELESVATLQNIRLHSFFSEKDIACTSPFLCPSLLTRTVIAANGDVLACHKAYALKKEGIPAVYGNLHEQSFYDIWHSTHRQDTIRMITERHRKNFEETGMYECGVCDGCKYTNVNQINRWLIENVV